MSSTVTCVLCSGVGGKTGMAYIEHKIVFTSVDRAVCSNCGIGYVWSRSSVAFFGSAM